MSERKYSEESIVSDISLTDTRVWGAGDLSNAGYDLWDDPEQAPPKKVCRTSPEPLPC